jgi:hypothetical protein
MLVKALQFLYLLQTLCNIVGWTKKNKWLPNNYFWRNMIWDKKHLVVLVIAHTQTLNIYTRKVITWGKIAYLLVSCNL